MADPIFPPGETHTPKPSVDAPPGKRERLGRGATSNERSWSRQQYRSAGGGPRPVLTNGMDTRGNHSTQRLMRRDRKKPSTEAVLHELDRRIAIEDRVARRRQET